MEQTIEFFFGTPEARESCAKEFLCFIGTLNSVLSLEERFIELIRQIREEQIQFEILHYEEFKTYFYPLGCKAYFVALNTGIKSAAATEVILNVLLNLSSQKSIYTSRRCISYAHRDQYNDLLEWRTCFDKYREPMVQSLYDYIRKKWREIKKKS
jgi:hypothetical protein